MAFEPRKTVIDQLKDTLARKEGELADKAAYLDRRRLETEPIEASIAMLNLDVKELHDSIATLEGQGASVNTPPTPTPYEPVGAAETPVFPNLNPSLVISAGGLIGTVTS